MLELMEKESDVKGRESEERIANTKILIHTLLNILKSSQKQNGTIELTKDQLKEIRKVIK